jgi:hypothetical protein
VDDAVREGIIHRVNEIIQQACPWLVGGHVTPNGSYLPGMYLRTR